MRAEIKNLFSLEIDDLERFAPANPADFRVAMRLVAGPEGEDAGESFDFHVCSATALMRSVEPGEVVLLRHILLVDAFDFASVRSFVAHYVGDCQGDTWSEVALKLARLGYWEFEDYRP